MSGYDDPRWYEEPDHTNNLTPAEQSASDDFDQYPFLPSQSSNTTPAPAEVEQSHNNLAQQLTRQILITTTLVVVAFVAGWFGNQYIGNYFNQSNQSKYYEQLFDQAWTTVDKNYVDRKDINYKNMSYAAMQAMVATLQDKGHSRFMTPTDAQSESQQLSGQFTGIGIYLSLDAKTQQLIITSTIPGAPAAKGGLKSGDVITAVDGTSVVGKGISYTSNLIQGQAGTTVTLTIQRPGVAKPLKFSIQRAAIQEPNVFMHYTPESHTADIQVLQFSSGTANQVKSALTQAKSMGATKIILDLRNNPGGYLDEAIDTASLFIKSGNVLLEEDSTGQRTPVPVNGKAVDTTDPMVVLVNGDTASAAEIVTGALKDNHRATVIGEQTYGTGTVLEQFTLADGSALLLGTQEWLTPDGQFIRGTSTTHGGIVPNIVVKQNADTVLSPNQENQANMTQQQILNSGDAQLVATIHYLAGRK